MRDLDTVLNDLQYEIRQRMQAQDELDDVARRGLSPAKEDEVRQLLSGRVAEARGRCLRELERILDFSPRHLRHKDQLTAFWREGSYEDSVFVMTKFPRPGSVAVKDVQLEKVLSLVATAVEDAGFRPRIARGTPYHPLLWDNVELHLLGCSRAIAVVEDKYLPELNPNVVMEWGWVRAATKPVLFLLEQEFTRLRADLDGLIKGGFDWRDPEPGISDSVANFLKR